MAGFVTGTRLGNVPTVLVVDDEDAHREALVDILTARGYRTIAVGTAADGIRRVTEDVIDAALVDLRLPDDDGIDLTARIRDQSPSTAVIILTGHAALETAIRAVNIGAVGYLEKPYDIDRLFLTLEQALTRSDKHRSKDTRLVEMLCDSPIAIIVHTVQTGEIVTSNCSARTLLGTPSNVNNIQQLLDNDSAQLVTQHLTRLRERGHANIDFRSAKSGGLKHWYELHSTLLPNHQDLAIGVVVDVTERRSSEHACEQDLQHFAAIFENLSNPVAVIDRSLVIMQVNPAFARFFRTAPEVLIGRRCHTLVHGHPVPCQFLGEYCPVANSLATGTVVRVPHRHSDPDGTVHYLEETVTPLRDAGDVIVSFVVVYNDYTEIKNAQNESELKSRQLEELNRQLVVQREQLSAQARQLSDANAELLRLSATKDEFVSTVSHELRTPLTAISESINLVADGSLGDVSASQASFLQVASRNCRRLAEIINDLLDLSKIEAGRTHAHRRPISPRHVLLEVVETFAALARERQLALRLECPEQLPDVLADEQLVRRVLNNLLGNALKFTPQGTVTATAEQHDTEVVVSIQDTGIGIPAEEQPRVFERFYQGRLLDGARPRGTGLGLALTKQMVEMNGGRIWFETREGCGTKFSFTLPTVTPDANWSRQDES